MLRQLIEEIKKAGRGRPYDCVVGVSGGTDSSYLLMKAKDWGLRPLAAHYDNTWNSAIATENIRKITSALDVDLYTHVVDNKEVDDIKRAFLFSGVAEFDADTDIALVQVLRTAAAKNSIRYVLEGHSFMTEGISPVGGNYLDGAYVAGIHKKYGQMPMKTFPNMTFFQFMKWVLIYNQRFIRPLWYVEYDKESAQRELEERTGWSYYGGHHLENRASQFAHTVWLPQRFDTDYRNLSLAAKARSGKMDRKQALETYNERQNPDPDLIGHITKRLKISGTEYEEIMSGPKRTFRDFRTYKRWFERLRPLYYVLAKANRVPMSFYLKYCFPIEDPQ